MFMLPFMVNKDVYMWKTFAIQWLLNTPAHLKCVAIHHACEKQMQEKLTTTENERFGTRKKTHQTNIAVNDPCLWSVMIPDSFRGTLSRGDFVLDYSIIHIYPTVGRRKNGAAPHTYRPRNHGGNGGRAHAPSLFWVRGRTILFALHLFMPKCFYCWSSI